MSARIIALDTETTGTSISDGHRLVEIGCAEIINRKRTGVTFHRLLNPGRAIDADAQAVHGLRNQDLIGKPVFSEIASELISFISGATLVIHNASFDIGFLEAELRAVNLSIHIHELCSVIDTLSLARRMHPGQRNNLDALSRRYGVNGSARADRHGALIDAELLADVYLAMTAGQSAIAFKPESLKKSGKSSFVEKLNVDESQKLVVILATPEERAVHENRMVDVHHKHIKALVSKLSESKNFLVTAHARLTLIETADGLDDTSKPLMELRQSIKEKEFEIAMLSAELDQSRSSGPVKF